MALQKTEISAGGIVLKKNPPQVLMVQVKNLIGKPKMLKIPTLP